MKRIGTPTAVADKFGLGKPGFTDGIPGFQVATDLEAEQFDHFQEELCAIVEGEGFALDPAKRDQVYTAIQGMFQRQGAVVNSITALRALPKTGARRAFVTRYYADVEGGGGEYWCDLADTASADNGGTIIVANDGGRWKLRITGPVTFQMFGCLGRPEQSHADTLAGVTRAWNSALAHGHDLYAPAGIYEIGDANFPWRQADLIPAALLDCKNVTIYGDGPATVFKTASVNGADVFQLNGLKNFNIRNLKLASTITGTEAGSNGVSITGGYDNLTVMDVWCEDLAYVDKNTYSDGGKALSIQAPVAGVVLECGTLKARIYAKGCVYGFGLECDLVAASTKKTSIEVDLVAEDCREAVVFSSGAATGALPVDLTNGLRVRAQAINCMRDVTIGRAHGVDVECNIITTKTKAQRVLSYTGSKWASGDTVADIGGLYVAYAKHSRIHVYGSKGDCGYKAQIGGANSGASGLDGTSNASTFILDVAGTSAEEDLGISDYGGNVANNCVFILAPSITEINAGFYLPSRSNSIIRNATHLVKDLLVQNAVKFTYTDGVSSYAEMGYDDEAVTFKQTVGTGDDLRVVKVLNHTGSLVAGFRNDGSLVSQGRATANAVATVKGVMPVFDDSNALVGYLPIYTSFTS